MTPFSEHKIPEHTQFVVFENANTAREFFDFVRKNRDLRVDISHLVLRRKHVRDEDQSNSFRGKYWAYHYPGILFPNNHHSEMILPKNFGMESYASVNLEELIVEIDSYHLFLCTPQTFVSPRRYLCAR